MKSTKKITLSAVMAAVAVVIMLCSYFPYLTYSIPAIACLFVLVPTLELGLKWGWITYAVAAVLTLFTGELEAKLVFVLVLGYYPMLKESVERLHCKPLEYIIKLVAFNAAVLLFYLAMTKLGGVDPAEFGMGMRFGQLLLLALANALILVFDAALTRLTAMYFIKYHERIRKMLK